MLNACTIIAKNYAPFARVLAESLTEHHADARLSVLVVDDFEGYLDPSAEPFDIVRPNEIGLPEFERMAGYYEILELTTAVKPWLLRHLLPGHDHVIYLDPDIRIFGSCALLADLAEEHGVVLTPHNVVPMPRDGKKPSEQDILIAGSYNLGFISLRRDTATDRLLDWWSERLLTQCIVDPERGLFVDQRWIDFVPGMMPDHYILRDPGYNVAYWNLASRPMTRADDGAFLADGSPLRFFHFSGFDPRTPETLSKHQNRVAAGADPVLRELCADYAADLMRHGYASTIEWDYTYAHTANGTRLDRPSRRLYLSGLLDGSLEGSLFHGASAHAFDEYATAPASGADPRVSRYLATLWSERVDLRAGFPTLTGHNANGLVEWAQTHGPQQLGDAFRWTGLNVDPRPSVEATASAAKLEIAPQRETTGQVPAGVNLVGYLRAELGVGEVARQVVAALDAVGEPVLPLVQIAEASRQGHTFAGTNSSANPFPINLLCVNADQTPAVADAVGEPFFTGRHTIGWWWWEVSSFPTEWHAAFEHVDEIWAGSRFVADSLQAVSPVPVLRMPLAVAAPRRSPIGRSALGLPEDRHVFLYAFDHNSVFGRKNPLGAVEAFNRAFEPGEGPILVLKSINGDVHAEAHARLVDAVGGRKDIILMDRYLSALEKDALIHACDTYVSLHRSEGFGITIAEAMAVGKPAIATRYSGNLDFMTNDNSFLVDAKIVPVGPGNTPYPTDGSWAQPDLDVAAALMRRVVEHPEEARERGQLAAQHMAEHHSHSAAGSAMQSRLDEVRRRMTWTPLARQEYAAQARAETTHLMTQGPPRSSRRRIDPRRALRGALIRAIRPFTLRAQENDRALMFSLEESIQALTSTEVRLEAEIEALRLVQARRSDTLDMRVAHEERRVNGLLDTVDNVKRHLDGLQAFAERGEQRLRELQQLEDAATSEPFMSQRFTARNHPVVGRVIGYHDVDAAEAAGYHGFEDLFRGPESLIRDRQRRYLPLLTGHEPILDAGCGRGELLDLLVGEGMEATGVDLDPELVAYCRTKGHHNVYVGDVVDWLADAPDASLGAVFSAQVIEHLSADSLERFLTESRRALRPDGLFIAETVNPHSLQALRMFWIDLSHESPIYPEVLLQLCRSAGFNPAFAFMPNGTGDYEEDRRTAGEFAVVAEPGETRRAVDAVRGLADQTNPRG